MSFAHSFAADVPVHSIDLDRPAAERWRDVIAAERAGVRALFDAGIADAKREVKKVVRSSTLTDLLVAGAPYPIALLYRLSKGRYREEIDAWAQGLGLSSANLTFMQCMYELSHLGPKGAATLGCSAGIAQDAKLGLVHVRTLDWNVPGMGDLTRLFRFHRGARDFFVVGIPGMVGALSGMVPGGFSATINWAPPAANPFFYYGPLFHLRHVLETCDTFAAAVNELSTTRLASSVFYTICGVKPGEACVVEYVKTGAGHRRSCRVRKIESTPLVQTNHYQHPDHEQYNGAVHAGASALLASSRARADQLRAALSGLRADRVEDFLGALDGQPVDNEETRQKMAFHPASGRLAVTREI